MKFTELSLRAIFVFPCVTDMQDQQLEIKLKPGETEIQDIFIPFGAISFVREVIKLSVDVTTDSDNVINTVHVSSREVPSAKVYSASLSISFTPAIWIY